MGRKVFVSYKYNDESVQRLPGMYLSKVCDYVKCLEEKVLVGNIYKGEHQDEDLSWRDENYIWKHLRDKIWDSSITVVLLSPNMKEPRKWERSQWIPWEISYSLRETTRSDRKSHRNSVVAVVLPNEYGLTSWFDKNTTFPILRANLVNDYIYLTEWKDFCKNPEYAFEQADLHRLCTGTGKIVISLNY